MTPDFAYQIALALQAANQQPQPQQNNGIPPEAFDAMFSELYGAPQPQGITSQPQMQQPFGYDPQALSLVSGGVRPEMVYPQYAEYAPTRSAPAAIPIMPVRQQAQRPVPERDMQFSGPAPRMTDTPQDMYSALNDMLFGRPAEDIAVAMPGEDGWKPGSPFKVPSQAGDEIEVEGGFTPGKPATVLLPDGRRATVKPGQPLYAQIEQRYGALTPTLPQLSGVAPDGTPLPALPQWMTANPNSKPYYVNLNGTWVVGTLDGPEFEYEDPKHGRLAADIFDIDEASVLPPVDPQTGQEDRSQWTGAVESVYAPAKKATAGFRAAYQSGPGKRFSKPEEILQGITINVARDDKGMPSFGFSIPENMAVPPDYKTRLEANLKDLERMLGSTAQSNKEFVEGRADNLAESTLKEYEQNLARLQAIAKDDPSAANNEAVNEMKKRIADHISGGATMKVGNGTMLTTGPTAKYFSSLTPDSYEGVMTMLTGGNMNTGRPGELPDPVDIAKLVAYRTATDMPEIANATPWSDSRSWAPNASKVADFADQIVDEGVASARKGRSAGKFAKQLQEEETVFTYTDGAGNETTVKAPLASVLQNMAAAHQALNESARAGTATKEDFINLRNAIAPLTGKIQTPWGKYDGTDFGAIKSDVPYAQEFIYNPTVEQGLTPMPGGRTANPDNPNGFNNPGSGGRTLPAPVVAKPWVKIGAIEAYIGDGGNMFVSNVSDPKKAQDVLINLSRGKVATTINNIIAAATYADVSGGVTSPNWTPTTTAVSKIATKLNQAMATDPNLRKSWLSTFYDKETAMGYNMLNVASKEGFIKDAEDLIAASRKSFADRDPAAGERAVNEFVKRYWTSAQNAKDAFRTSNMANALTGQLHQNEYYVRGGTARDPFSTKLFQSFQHDIWNLARMLQYSASPAYKGEFKDSDGATVQFFADPTKMDVRSPLRVNPAAGDVNKQPPVLTPKQAEAIAQGNANGVPNMPYDTPRDVLMLKAPELATSLITRSMLDLMKDPELESLIANKNHHPDLRIATSQGRNPEDNNTKIYPESFNSTYGALAEALMLNTVFGSSTNRAEGTAGVTIK